MSVPTAMSVCFNPPASVESLVSADLPQENFVVKLKRLGVSGISNMSRKQVTYMLRNGLTLETRRINKKTELEIASALTAARAATEKARSKVDILTDVAECSERSSVAAVRGTVCADSTDAYPC